MLYFLRPTIIVSLLICVRDQYLSAWYYIKKRFALCVHIWLLEKKKAMQIEEILMLWRFWREQDSPILMNQLQENRFRPILFWITSTFALCISAYESEFTWFFSSIIVIYTHCHCLKIKHSFKRWVIVHMHNSDNMHVW